MLAELHVKPAFSCAPPYGGACLACILLLSLKAAAGTFCTDPFDYLPGGGGTIHNRNGGTGWAGPWTTNALGNHGVSGDATGRELRFAPAGGELIDGGTEAVDVSGTVNQPVAFRVFAAPQASEVYITYLLRLVAGSWTDTDTLSFHLANNGTNTATLNFGVRGQGFMARNGTGTPLAGDSIGSATNDVTYLLVARVRKPNGASTFDQMDLWVNPGLYSFNAPDATLTLASGTGLSSISHIILRAAALETADLVRVDELRLASTWQDIIVPVPTVPTVQSLTLMHPGTAGVVAGYDPLTDGAMINLFSTGTNVTIRANTTPPVDFGSVLLSLTGATVRQQVEDTEPWALFGDEPGSYEPAYWNTGAHTLTVIPYDADGGPGGMGMPGKPLTVSFTVTNYVVVSNRPPVVSLTSPAGGTTFTAPGTVILRANAIDSDGSITNVEFFSSETRIGEDAVPPYELTWQNVQPGAYAFQARAVDDQGASAVSPVVIVSALSTNHNGVVTGELKHWHRVTVTWDGPETSETATPNPFRDYRLNVTLSHALSGKSYVVPGFFAADGNAADTGATGGSQWRVHFSPDEPGTWTFVASFRTGPDIVTNKTAMAGLPTGFDAATGTFNIAPSDKTGRDFRAKGRLQYVGKHHLRFAGTGEYFLKMGADSPENLLAYADFDDTPNTGGRLKTYSYHTKDYVPADVGAYTWKGGKGTNLLGALRYLADKGMNAISFLPFSLDGDDDNVFPHRLADTVAAFQAVPDNQRWSRRAVHRDRFDISKIDQWDRVFQYGQKLGLYLHFKTLETENEMLMDGGSLGIERTLYYREIIARFGYHLALNWNLGEEIDTASTVQKQSWSQYFYDVDPYRHHQVIHNGANHYDLLGNASRLTGYSRQTHPDNIFADTLNYLHRSATNGRPWVVAYDEQNPAGDGIITDGEDFHHDRLRGKVIWSHLLAGGTGVETYFGYNHPHNDLNCEDFRSRDNWWNQCRYALEFFRENAIPFWSMTNRDALLSAGPGSHCFAMTGTVYVAYLPVRAPATLDLRPFDGVYQIRWFNPRTGGILQTGSVGQMSAGGVVSLGEPPATSTNDWVVLVRARSPQPRLTVISSHDTFLVAWEGPEWRLERARRLPGPWELITPSPVSPYALPRDEPELYVRLRWAPVFFEATKKLTTNAQKLMD